jgi:peptidoglycan/xylan/chitin deacetylase (PgdA/CDA1 family)
MLVYHRFGPVVADRMTVTTSAFASQLAALRTHGYTVIPLRQLVAYRLGTAPPPAPRSVVITVDDGHRSVYTEMFPLVMQAQIPVTLFVYPSALSHAPYALSWAQLQTLQATGLFDVQSHSYWHPNFRREKRRLAPEHYAHLVAMQLTCSKAILERRLGIHVTMLAWPFGIYDDELIHAAAAAGYVAAVTLERRHARTADPLMALPRYLVTAADQGQAFERLLAGAGARQEQGGY